MIHCATKPCQVALHNDDAIQDTILEGFDNFDAFNVDDKEDAMITFQEEAIMHQEMLCKAIHTRTQERMKRRKVDSGITVASIMRYSIHCLNHGSTPINECYSDDYSLPDKMQNTGCVGSQIT